MLLELALNQVGPSESVTLKATPRLNLITGDNGLGKTFLLDIAWWALTNTWPDYIARPRKGCSKTATIKYKVKSKAKPVAYTSRFDPRKQAWVGKVGRPPIPGMVIYARIDGGYGVWDPARNYWNPKDQTDELQRPPAYLFKHDQVWNGLFQNDKPICKGLIQDWTEWQLANGVYFGLLKELVTALSPDQDELLKVGPLQRISLDDVREFPTVSMSYGEDVPIVYASSAIRRIMGLAYLLVWTWREHLAACQLREEPPTNQIVFLIDEIDAHLHPRWQRTILKSLMAVTELLTGDHQVSVQILATTHSPLIPASMEHNVDPKLDSLWTFHNVKGRVQLTQEPWLRRGEIDNWLTSDAIGIKIPRNREGEKALEKALAFLRHEGDQDLATMNAIDQELKAVLGETDRFWIRWSRYVQQRLSFGSAGCDASFLVPPRVT